MGQSFEKVMKHFLPVNIGDAERVGELIYVRKEQVLHAAFLIGALSCARSWGRHRQGRGGRQLSLCRSAVPASAARRHGGQEGLRHVVMRGFTDSPFQ